MAPAVHYMAILKKHVVIVTLVLTICWSLGNTDNPISGSGNFIDCTNPQNVNLSLSSPTANVTVTWDLPLAPYITCMYNYTVMFTVGSIELVEATTRLLTDEEITDCRLEIPPSILRSDLNMFEPGVTVVVNISLVDGDSSIGSIDIPGVFAPPVTDFSVTMVSPMSLTLQWGLAYDPAVPTSYNISYRFRDLTGNSPVQGPVTEIVLENDTFDDSSSDLAITYLVNGLQAFSEYNLTITAVYGETNISSSLATNGRTTESAPTYPLNFTIEEVIDEPGQLNASWISPMNRNGILRNYSVSCRITLDQFYNEQVPDNLTEFIQRTSTDGDTTTTIVMGLEPFTKYQCQVTASTDEGESPVSNSDNATTDEAAPTEPVDLNVASRTATSISLQWTRPVPTNGIITMYTLDYTNGSISDTINIPVEPVSQEYNVTNITVDSLNEFTNYTFNLSATTGGGIGPAATLPDVLTNEAAPSAAPVNVTGMNASSTSLRISWLPPPVDGQNGIITAYNITYVTAGESEMMDSTLGSTQFIELTGLMKFRTYNISVAASTSIGIGPSETVTVTTDTDVPSAPQGLQYTNLTSTSIQVTWRPPMSINGVFQRYIIMVTQLVTQNSTNQTLDTTNVNVTMFNITDLEEFERYTIVVYGETDAGVGPGSDPLEILTDEGVPEVVQQPSAVEINSTTIAVSWREPLDSNGIITLYEVEYTLNATSRQNFSVSQLMTSSDTFSNGLYTVRIGNLQAFREYTIRIRAYTFIGPGSYSSAITVVTDPTAPLEPTNVTAFALNSTAIILRWSYPETPNGPILGYIIRSNASLSLQFPNVEIIPNGQLNFTLQQLNDMSDQNLVFTELAPFTTYLFSVRALAVQNDSEFIIHEGVFSPEVTATTDEEAPTAPVNFTLTRVMNASQQLNGSWSAPINRNGILRNYSVSCRITLDQFYNEQVPDNLTEFTQRTSTDGDTTTAIVMDLEPFTKYQCQVTASTDGGESPVSNSDNATTDEAAPTEPVDLNVASRTATSISLQWSRPIPTNGIITMYTLGIYTDGSISRTINIPVEPVSQEYNVTNITVDSLNEFTNYTFNLSATTGGGIGPAATLPDVLTNEAAPSAAPVNVTGMNTSSTSLRISWLPPPVDGQNGIITAYNITYVTAGESEMMDSTLGSTQFIELTGLLKFRTYNISVAASTSVGIGPSETVTVTTDTDVPSAPQELQYTNLSSTSIQVTWRPPVSINGIFQRYIIMVTQLVTQTSTNQTLDTTNVNVTMFNITDLEDFERYTIVVYGETDAGVGPGSDPLDVLTDEGAPTTPLNFTIEEVIDQPGQLNASWNSPMDRNGILRNYSVSCRITLDQFYNEQVPDNLTEFTQRTSTDGDTTTAIVMGLEPFTKYQCQVTASTDGGESPVSNSDDATTDEAAPTEPVDLNVASRTATSISLQWSRPIPTNGIITMYTLGIYTDGSISPTINIPVEPVSQEYNVTNFTVDTLNEFTNYTFNLSATTGGGIGPAATLPDVLTNEAAPSAAPVNVTGMNTSSTSLRISWLPPPVDGQNGIITAYNITYVTAGESEMIDSTLGSTQFIELTGLLKFRTYDISVAASTSVGIGPSETVTVTTDTDVPSAPQELQYTNLSSTSIQVTWRPPMSINGVFQRYIIMVTQLVTQNSMNQTLDTTNVNMTMFNITDLEEFERYTIVVYGETDAGVGPGSDPLDVLTDEGAPTSPLNFAVEEVTGQPGQLNASWNSPMDRNGILRNYSVSCRITLDQFYNEQVPDNLAEFTQRTSTDGDTTTTIVMDLEPFTKYQCHVTASTDGGESPVSNSDNATTDEAAPTEPVDLNVASRTATSISLQWSRPIPTNGIITMYTLGIYTDGSILRTMNIPVEPVSQEYNVTNFTVDRLNEFTSYTFNLSATTGGGIGPAATLPDVLTNEAAPSAAPVNVTGMNTSSTSLRISWLPPPVDGQNGIITAYNITYVTAGESEMIDSTLGSTHVQFIELTELMKFRTYNISVAASTSVGIGPSETVTVTTDTDVPSAPQGLQYTNLSSTSIQVTWRPPMSINGIFQRFIIMVTQLVTQNSTNQTLDTTNVNVTMFNITDLEEFESYTIVVYGETDAGVGPGSDPLDVLTDEGVPSAPRNVVLSNVSATAINVTWMEPSSRNGVITHYTISYIGTKSNNNNNFGGRINRNLFVNVSASCQSVLLCNLLADTIYNANVTAFTSVGAGDVGIGNMIRLPVGPPPQLNISEPSNSTSGPPTDRGFTINFMIPEEAQANGPITRFIIIIRVVGSTNDTISTYYESFRHDPPDQAPPYQAVEEPQMQGNKRQNEVLQNEMVVVIGDPNVVCGPTDQVCNGPLNPNTEYQYKYRLFTNDNNQFFESGYSEPITTAVAATDTMTTTNIIIAVVVSLVFIIAIIIIIVVVLIIYRSRRGKGGNYDFMKTNGGTAGLAGSKSSTETNIPLVASGPSIVPLSDNLPHTKPAAPKAAGKIPQTRKLYMRDLPGYIADMMSDSGYKFSEEYEKVTAIGLEHSKDASLMPENRAKNRYTNILAYDHSRVKLSSVDDEPGSDYINANYIPGYRMRRAYIATQGPLPSTFDDFWNMVWEQNTHNIVMLTQLVERGRTKCHRYWPGTQSEVYADIIVEMMSEKELSEWTFRELRLTKEKRSRTVKHFQFTSWPDHGVPESPSSVIDFVREVRGSVQGPHGPMVIHCSAGVGRTGTFIGLDTLLQHIKDHDWVDIFGLACEMRLHRNHMIQTEAQYVFIHKSMLEVCEYLAAYKSFENKLDFSPIYANAGIHSQTDMYGDLLSEEVSQEKSYDETKM